MNTTEHAQLIRTTLKSHNISARQVSVKSSSFSMGSAIDVMIKDPNVSFKLVNDIAQKAEVIRRCEITGDILSGCNRYVSVNFSTDACKALESMYLDAVQNANNELLTSKSNTLVAIAGTDMLLGRSQNYGFSVWSNDSHVAECASLEEVTYVIGGAK